MAEPAPKIMNAQHVSLIDARAQGRTRYFTGAPCKHGHVAERKAHNGECAECSRLADKKRRISNGEKQRAARRAWYVNNREHAITYARNWANANREKVRVSGWKHEGVPLPTRDDPGLCECCNGMPKGKGRLHLDHDHRTSKFRGWLCFACNTSIGKLGDDIAGLQRAVAYLQRTE